MCSAFLAKSHLLTHTRTKVSTTGLTTVHYSPQAQKAFITAFTDHPFYHMFLGAPKHSWPAPKGVNIKIPIAAPLGEKVFFADSNNSLSWADLNTTVICQISPKWADKVKKEMSSSGWIILSMGVTKTQPTLLRCLCRKGSRLRFLQTPVEEEDKGDFYCQDVIPNFWGV